MYVHRMDRNKMTKINPNVERIEIEKVTFKGYVIQGTHCILKPTQLLTLQASMATFVEHCTSVGMKTELTLDDHILTTIHNVTGKDIKSFQVGADRTSNMTPKMIELNEAINTMVLDGADCIVNGKPMFIGVDGTPREFSGTFTLRTPTGVDRLEYIKELTKQVKSATKELTK